MGVNKKKATSIQENNQVGEVEAGNSDKIYMPHDNKITITYICIFMRNSFISGNHPSVHVILFIKNKVNFTYKTKLKEFIHTGG